MASSSFDDFHKNSSEIIRFAVFGRDENGNIKERVMITTFFFVAPKFTEFAVFRLLSSIRS